MARVDEIVSAQFRAWEERGRGWKVYQSPVSIEPPFRPFNDYRLPEIEDDGRKQTILSSLFGSVRGAIVAEPPKRVEESDPEPEPEQFERNAVSELQILLPEGLKIGGDHFVAFLDALDACYEPVAFELLGQHDGIIAQFAGHPRDIEYLNRHISALFPNAAFLPTENRLQNAWEATRNFGTAVDFGLEDEFILPLTSNHAIDPFIGIITAMGQLKVGDLALFQVIFVPSRNPWPVSALRAITNAEGKSRFLDFGQFLTGSKKKFNTPLFAAVIRVAVQASDPDRAWELTRNLAFALRVYSNPEGNGLIPLHNREYPAEEHWADILRRQSRRTGLLLNRDELMGFVHLPSEDIRSSRLKRQIERTKAAPLSNARSTGLFLGENHHIGNIQPVTLSPPERTRHVHLIGASGTGKSTLLFNMIAQDIDNGEGIAVLDPHGDLIDRILGIIPPERIGDVVLIDPADEEFSVGFNFLSAHSDLEKNLLSSDLVSVFHRLSATWGDQMGSVLHNAILAFLESTRGGTISDLRRFLIEPAYREEFLCTISDPDIVYYWKKGFAQLSGNKSIGPVITRLDTFLAPKPIRYMVTQEKNKIDFANILDTGKIFLAKLSQGQIGRENSFLLGSLLVAKFQQLAMGRQTQAADSRRPFYLYIDEFQNFITPSMAEILSGARKYNLGLILAHQELRQLERDREVASAVLSNPYTRVVFRVGDADARALESGFSYFQARDLQNLETGQAICRIEKAANDFSLTIPLSDFPSGTEAEARRNEVIKASREKYGESRSVLDARRRTLDEAEAANKQSTRSKKPAEEPSTQKKSEGQAASASAPPKSKGQPSDPPPIVEIESAPRHTETVETKPPTSDKGIGGNQHNLIRERIEIAARELSFTASREAPAQSGGKIDLVVENSDQAIACEIAITTTIDHEVGNVAKCLKMGFKHVAVISPTVDRLEKIKAAVLACVSAEEARCVAYYQPDEFIVYLRSRKAQDTTPVSKTPVESKFGKYKVKRKAVPLTHEEMKEREAAALAMLAEAMRKKK